jgi:hypothetical protein
MITVDIRVPPTEFRLGSVLRDTPDVEVDLRPVVPVGSGEATPLLAVRGETETFERRVRSAETVDRLRHLGEADGADLYRLSWSSPEDGLFRAIDESGAVVVGGRKRGEEWSLRLWFPDQDAVDAFTAACDRDGVAADTGRVSSGLPDGTFEPVLSPAQEEILRLAHHSGYFGVPRSVTMGELGAELGISQQAASERFRRGLGELLERRFGRGEETGR